MSVAEFRIVAYPILCLRENDSAQDLAALHLRGLFLLLCRFGMKRAFGFCLAYLRGDRGECAMIRDRDP